MRMLRLTRSNEIEKVVVGVKSMIKRGEKKPIKDECPLKKRLRKGRY